MIEEVETRYGKMFLPDTDIAQYWWFKTIGVSAEDDHVEMVCNLLKERPRGIALDVGANFGAWTLPLVAVATDVVAIEPQKGVYDCLQRTLEPVPNVIAYRCAVGDADSWIDVPILDLDAPANFGGVTLGMAHHEQPDVPMEKVIVAPLDSILKWARRDIAIPMSRWVSFIKIDVEGAEPAALRGAKNIIAYHRPILFVEAVHKYTDTPALAEQIKAMGYAIDNCGPNFLGMPL